MKLRSRFLVISAVVAALIGAYVAGRHVRISQAPTSTCAPIVIVALEPTPVPLGLRQMLPVFSHHIGGTVRFGHRRRHRRAVLEEALPPRQSDRRRRQGLPRLAEFHVGRPTFESDAAN